MGPELESRATGAPLSMGVDRQDESQPGSPSQSGGMGHLEDSTASKDAVDSRARCFRNFQITFREADFMDKWNSGA